ncbi:hypothetical protein CPB83DRAFT_863316 [Crepidotus variabilis]|uniref:Nucleotidyltransferase n=1 Tax=Crepidotus variabilis TaxID=179855 RepID=A0A9P6E5X1_9AGAR|nr:hypothetical protein CPB83DRAFT_863316 [Crepidotus variabilis]
MGSRFTFPSDLRMRTLHNISNDVVTILKGMHFHCAIFGSFACSLYGVPVLRQPNDIDILVLPPRPATTESLKRAIFDHDNERFGLEPSLNPDCQHKILYYRLKAKDGPHGFFAGNKCKIDIVVPGVMELPRINSSHIKWLHDLPVLPFSILVLQKLQGWDDHRQMLSNHKKYAKAATDARDVQHLLTLENQIKSSQSAQCWLGKEVLTKEFVESSERRVQLFCQSYPGTQDLLSRILGTNFDH